MQALLCSAMRRGFHLPLMWQPVMVILQKICPISMHYLWSSIRVSISHLLKPFSLACSIWPGHQLLEGSLVVSKLFLLKNYGGNCALENLQCSRNVCVAFPRHVACTNPFSELSSWPHGSFSEAVCLVSCEAFNIDAHAFPRHVQTI